MNRSRPWMPTWRYWVRPSVGADQRCCGDKRGGCNQVALLQGARLGTPPRDTSSHRPRLRDRASRLQWEALGQQWNTSLPPTPDWPGPDASSRHAMGWRAGKSHWVETRHPDELVSSTGDSYIRSGDNRKRMVNRPSECKSPLIYCLTPYLILYP